jgi:trafficking protein particle complex subunit 8
MTPFSNVTPPEPSTLATSGEPSVRYPQKRPPADTQSLASSVSSLPYRRSNNSVSSLFASTSTPPGSRSISPNGPLRGLAGSLFITTPPEDILDNSTSGQAEDPRHLILQGYVPHIAIHTSTDTDELAGDKGFTQGLWQLLRPFGERVQGKVTIRDSNGASRACDDFAVRFVQLGDGLEKPNRPVNAQGSADSQVGGLNGNSVLKEQSDSNKFQPSRTGGDIDAIENLLEQHLSYAESVPGHGSEDDTTSQSALNSTSLSPFYRLYLRRLLSGIPLAPHETFSHPVACIIAISSRNLSPLEALRHLYDDSSRGERRLPLWVYNEYPRYYVLVHDEERDDISKSMALFEQMKRHFGLHCHLLRLRSSQCVPTDDDSTRLPQSEWISASEELAEIEARDIEEYVENASPCIFESDATAIRTFIREMVTQSVVPHMERNVSTWNEQVASRRRGISGRITNIITKKWGFGGSSRSSSAPGAQGSVAGSNSNYDPVQGFYRPDAPEAIMRKLADYAFMLRDWKLAQSIYDLLRTDFSSDKAWEYHAATNEMAAISSLLLPQALTAKVRAETVDLMLDTALYSYTTRGNSLYGAIRSLLLGMELLRLRGGSSTDDAARWGTKLIENNLLGSVGEPLLRERIAVCYATREGVGSGRWGARTRKAALWNVLAADDWLNLGKYRQAEKRLSDVSMLYDKLGSRDSLSYFATANEFLAGLNRELQAASFSRGDKDGQEFGVDEESSSMDEESEALDVRSHRKSLIGTNAPPLASLETAPLRSLVTTEEVPVSRDDDFV